MKKILVALLVCSILMMSGCTSRTESESDPRPATEESSDTQAENEEVIEEEEPQSSENETNDEDQQPSDSEISENPDENSASAQSTDADSFLYENSELGFSVQLPSCIEKNAEFTTDTRDDNGETVNIVSVTYQGESGQTNILTLEEMSSQSWENMQKQNGPIPVELEAPKMDASLSCIHSSPIHLNQALRMQMSSISSPRKRQSSAKVSHF